jgi:hypothetical protein
MREVLPQETPMLGFTLKPGDFSSIRAVARLPDRRSRAADWASAIPAPAGLTLASGIYWLAIFII